MLFSVSNFSYALNLIFGLYQCISVLLGVAATMGIRWGTPLTVASSTHSRTTSHFDIYLLYAIMIDLFSHACLWTVVGSQSTQREPPVTQEGLTGSTQKHYEQLI